MSEAAVIERGGVADSEEGEEGGKRRQILDGARRVFLLHGFDAASMNEIARVAGVSKGTLYVYFDSKESLFEDLIRQEKREQAEQVCRIDEDLGDDLRTALIELGTRLISNLLEPSRVAQFRTVVAVSAKFPRIGKAFYESGPRHGVQRLAAHLEQTAEAEGLAIDDYEMAAERLIDLCKSHHLLRAILNVSEPPSRRDVQAHVEAGVDTFLRAYRAR